MAQNPAVFTTFSFFKTEIKLAHSFFSFMAIVRSEHKLCNLLTVQFNIAVACLVLACSSFPKPSGVFDSIFF